jgi:hypothetical protein
MVPAAIKQVLTKVRLEKAPPIYPLSTKPAATENTSFFQSFPELGEDAALLGVNRADGHAEYPGNVFGGEIPAEEEIDDDAFAGLEVGDRLSNPLCIMLIDYGIRLYIRGIHKMIGQGFALDICVSEMIDRPPRGDHSQPACERAAVIAPKAAELGELIVNKR